MATVNKVFAGRAQVVMASPDNSSYWFVSWKNVTISGTSFTGTHGGQSNPHRR